MGDATKLADMNKVVSQVIEGFGGIDILVNCVGDSIRMPVANLPHGARRNERGRMAPHPGCEPDLCLHMLQRCRPVLS